jgi:flagellar hook protein FlgE
MSITSSMYNGAAGLGSHSAAMGVISDNIANVNTVGFRSSRANFSDVLGGMMAGSRTGAGSMIGSVQTMFNEGSLLGTGNTTDLAISGDGFFMVDGSVGGVEGRYFTRAGQFQVDEGGVLVNPAGLRVQGYGLDASGGIGSTLGDLQIGLGSLPPVATTTAGIDANLDAGQAIDPTPFDISDPGATSDFQSSVTVYDSLGNAHQLTMFFKKLVDTPSASWEVHVATAGADLDPAVATDFAELATGTLDFDTGGALAASSLGPINVQWSGADAASIALDVGTPISAGGTGLDGLTSYAGASAASLIEQDGSSTGELSDFQILPNGTVEGRYSNGETRALGQIATATFTNVDGLERQGESLFRAGGESRNPLVGTPGSNGSGAIVSGTLEGSNVDLAREFVTMIAVQRGFQSNSRTISTADEMLTELVNLKR